MRVDGSLSILNSSIGGRLHLEDTVVGVRLNLSGTKILMANDVALNCEGCSVGGAVSLNAGFSAHGAVKLDRSRIRADIHLSSCEIRASGMTALSLVGAHVSGDINVSARIYGEVDLSRSTVEGNAYFYEAWIFNTGGTGLKANRSSIKGVLDLSTSRIEAAIDMQHTSVAVLMDDERGWSDAHGIVLDGFTYAALQPSDRNIRVRWLAKAMQRNPEDARDPSWQPYEQLIQTLKRQGRERDARVVAIEKQRQIGMQGLGSPPARLLHWFFGTTMRWGYRPQRALVFAPFFVGALVAAFYAGADVFMEPTKDAAQTFLAQNGKLPRGYPAFNPTAYAVDTFVPVLNLQQKDSWGPNDRALCDLGPITRCGFWLRAYLWLHTAMGWLITTLAVAGFTGLVRKD